MVRSIKCCSSFVSSAISSSPLAMALLFHLGMNRLNAANLFRGQRNLDLHLQQVRRSGHPVQFCRLGQPPAAAALQLCNVFGR